MIAGRRLISGEMHYPRIPRADWRARLDMAYAMGLNAISTYVFWNLHEPRYGAYDFDGENDVAEFVREAARVGLDVILRPGPYVCAEWDFGGLPAWLLDGRAIALRASDDAYMTPVRAWLKRLGDELAPLQRARGGPIVAVQLENEYGAFGNDATYLQALRGALDDAGFGESPYFTIDQPQDLARGELPGTAIAATFAPGEARRAFESLRALRHDAPLACGEYWAGWFDRWGEPHQQRDDAQQAVDLAWMLKADASANIYMFHGGTNFGFSNGANAFEDGAYRPQTTSYDYLAALDEAGRPTAKYRAFRDVIAAATGIAARPIPAVPATIEIPRFEVTHSASLAGALRAPVERERPCSMEALGQSFGYILYRTILLGPATGTLDIGEARDYATVMLDDAIVGRLDRRLGESSLALRSDRDGATLDILVENCGRINYGPEIARERKGISGAVTLEGMELTGWSMYAVPLDDLSGLRFDTGPRSAPAFYRGRFDLAEPAGTFFDMQAFGKGVLFVNGRNAGRFWSVGPQRCLYVPGSWLARSNDVVVFDVIEPAAPLFIQGVREPILYP
jgi:beta-galactosidase